MHKKVSNTKPTVVNLVLGPANSIHPNALAMERIEVGPALMKSRVTKLQARVYPIQFRNQGAFDD